MKTLTVMEFQIILTDSDNDGCPDVIEAGFIDSDGDNILGDLQEIEFNEVAK